MWLLHQRTVHFFENEQHNISQYQLAVTAYNYVLYNKWHMTLYKASR